MSKSVTVSDDTLGSFVKIVQVAWNPFSLSLKFMFRDYFEFALCYCIIATSQNLAHSS